NARVRRLRELLESQLNPERSAANPMHIARGSADEQTVPLAKGSACIHLDLVDFNAEETRAYLQTLQKQLANEPAYCDIAEDLADVLADLERPNVLHYLTGGNPVQLALYIDLLVSGSTYPELFRYDLTTIENLPETERRTLKEDLDSTLLAYLTRRLGSSA